MKLETVIEMVGLMSTEDTKEVAKLCLGELSDTDAIEVIETHVAGDDQLTGELIANLEG